MQSTSDTQTVTVAVASLADKTVIEGMLQFYIYDFSDLEPATSAAFEFDAAGRFAPYPHLDEYWTDENRWPLLIRKGGHNVGFALINTISHRDGGAVERNMAEFFVARKHRRAGVAQQAFHQILARYPGTWEVAIAARNTTAKVFWPKAIAAAPNVTGLTALEGDGQHWRGPIYTFQARAH